MYPDTRTGSMVRLLQLRFQKHFHGQSLYLLLSKLPILDPHPVAALGNCFFVVLVGGRIHGASAFTLKFAASLAEALT
jgi:hypothetical protein